MASVPINSDRGTTFKETSPISIDIFTFAAGPWSKIYEANEDGIIRDYAKEHPGQNSISLDEVRRRSSYVYVRESQERKFLAHAQEMFQLKRETLKYLEDNFNFKFLSPKFDLVLIPEPHSDRAWKIGDEFLRDSGIVFIPESTVFK
jgi:hypothetical protein